MLLVKTTVRSSGIHGLGVFADEDIKEGTLVFQFYPRIDRMYPTAHEILAMSIPAQRFLYHYLWRSRRASNRHAYCLHGDDARFINHSIKPNLRIIHEHQELEYSALAAKDIPFGVELLWNYLKFDELDLSPGNLFELIRQNTGLEQDEYDRHVELGEPLSKS